MIIVYIIKHPVPVEACMLGANTQLEQMLQQTGRLYAVNDWQWRLRTLESPEEGQLVQQGDYIKLDPDGNPYPVHKDWFEKNHRALADGRFLQQTAPLKAWCINEPVTSEIQFLLDTGKLLYLPQQPETAFRAHLWNTEVTTPINGVIVLDQVDTDEEGRILHIDFHFIAPDLFLKSYRQL